MASLKVDLSKLRQMVERFKNSGLEDFARTLPSNKGVQALVAQAIADNFDKEGPGWAPLKRATIFGSISKKKKKEIKQMPQESRGKAIAASRMILNRGGILKKSVTTPGAHSIRRTDGKSLIWGTDLVYAGIHNKGGTIHHPGSKNAFGIPGLHTKPHNIPIPKREFLVIRPEWMAQINAYVKELLTRKIALIFKGGS